MVKVVSLVTRNKKINDHIVETLKTYLELAEKGELVALGLAGVLSEGNALTCACESDHFPALVGSISILQHRLMVNSPLLVDKS